MFAVGGSCWKGDVHEQARYEARWRHCTAGNPEVVSGSSANGTEEFRVRISFKVPNL
jgi:hypothetical protein